MINGLPLFRAFLKPNWVLSPLTGLLLMGVGCPTPLAFGAGTVHEDAFYDKAILNIKSLLDPNRRTLALPRKTRIFLTNSLLIVMSLRRQLDQKVYPYVSDDMRIGCSRLATRDFGINEKYNEDMRSLMQFSKEVKAACSEVKIKADDVYTSLVRFVNPFASDGVISQIVDRFDHSIARSPLVGARVHQSLLLGAQDQ